LNTIWIASVLLQDKLDFVQHRKKLGSHIDYLDLQRYDSMCDFNQATRFGWLALSVL